MRYFFIISCLFTIAISASGQNQFKIQGVVSDSVTGEKLAGVTVYTSDQKSFGYSDANGKYSFSVKPGTYTIIVDYSSYKQEKREVSVTGDVTINFSIAPVAKEVKEIVLKGKREVENVQDTKMSTIDIDIKQIKKLPALFGEVDVIKNIQMLPGVQVAGEGNSGLYVRGGGADQNLVLLDHATVYNPVHAIGIFSVFNSDVLGSAELYKGGIPAVYGGRLSSMVDVRTKEGNMKKWGATGGIGLLASRLMIEGPIAKDKASVFLSVRRTYFDYFLKFNSDENIRKTKLYFLDFNGKITWKINSKNTLNLSGYSGSDVLKLADLFRNDYGNQTASLDWKHIFNENLFSNTILTYSGFDYLIEVGQKNQELQIKNGIRDLALKEILTYDLNKNNELTGGIEASYKDYYPGSIEPGGSQSIFKPFKVPYLSSLDGAVFIANKHKITQRLTADYGLRYSIFNQIGAGREFIYSSSVPTDKTIIDTVQYGNFDRMKTYGGLEPRIGVRYMLTESSSLKASYNRMYQYLHLMSNTTSPVPSNIWMPSTRYLKPEKADQVAGGYFRNFKDNMYESSIELYYKKMNNVVDFIDNADVWFNPHPETDIRAGKSTAYGTELFLRKLKGKTTGWISYTLSKVTRQIDGVNAGKVYPAGYDRRHNLNVVFTYQLTEKITLSGNFVYGSGRPYTAPGATYNYDIYRASYYTTRNGLKLRDYHRVDLAANWDLNKKGKFKSSINVSVYNVYGRKNPYTVLVRDKESGQGQEMVMIYLFRWLPSITYNFSF
jgi:hypothetical protein